jgi:hypothetical protein
MGVITGTVLEVSVGQVRDFIEQHHYSKNINGCKVSKCFALYYESTMVGAMLFGQLSTTSWKKYAEKEEHVVELRRLVCLDSCAKNTESWFIAKAIRILKKEAKYKVCVSYADPHYGHMGFVYQAANWSYHGQTAPDTVLLTEEGKRYHSRAMRTKYNGELKPFAKRLQQLHSEGRLTEIKVPGKHIYTYTLVGKHKAVGLPYPKDEF